MIAIYLRNQGIFVSLFCLKNGNYFQNSTTDLSTSKAHLTPAVGLFYNWSKINYILNLAAQSEGFCADDKVFGKEKTQRIRNNYLGGSPDRKYGYWILQYKEYCN